VRRRRRGVRLPEAVGYYHPGVRVHAAARVVGAGLPLLAVRLQPPRLRLARHRQGPTPYLPRHAPRTYLVVSGPRFTSATSLFTRHFGGGVCVRLILFRGNRYSADSL
jgi:hypothetical protein